MIVERLADDEEPQYPGRVFEDQSLDYAEAMHAFVAASAQSEQREKRLPADGKEETAKAAIRRLRREEERLRIQRRDARSQRKQEDIAWKTLRQQHRHEEIEFSQQRARYGERKVWHKNWQALRTHRRQVLEQRHQEDQVWREQRHILRTQLAELPIVTDWIAILVITDNCTRQCLGLPLFMAGANVTSEMVVDALRTLLPAELQFLISDRGVHFTANAFKELAHTEEFVHVVIARHRPQSNGIAERFVRTLKEWLAFQSWKNAQELLALLSMFRSEYNDRPHQGLPIPGLSPNEFANRIWLF
ncbi:MAG: transposase [Anaerolineales bacterium]|nr:transposase [Anaerolineales bacterium]